MDEGGKAEERVSAGAGPFRAHAFVLVTLNSPREKFWGAILEVAGAGVTVRGIDLNSFDDFARLVRAGEPVTPAAVFFPMQRIERMEIDARYGDIPSLRERFASKAGQDMARVMDLASPPGIEIGCTLEQAQQRLITATLVSVGQDVERAADILGMHEDDLRSWMRR